MRVIPIVLILAIATACTKKEQDRSSVLIKKVDSLFNTVPDYWGVVLIADKGLPVYERSYGLRDVNTGEPNDMSTIFELASVSKQFTSMAIMMLKEEGKLSFDDPVENYIPGLPYNGITIRHLLNHTSGLPDYQAVMDKYWDKSKVAGNADNISYLIKYQPPVLFEPGSKYKYSNTGYMLLGSIIEKASGHDFISFCKTRIFVPVQMTSTGIRTREEKVHLKNMAWGHNFISEKNAFIRADSFPENNYAIWLGNRVGPGRVSSTVGDLLKWDRALYGDSLVSKPTLEEAFTPALLNNDSPSMYGFGWQLENNNALGKIVRHSGNNPGYNTHIVRMIDKDKTVIMLCNNEHEKFDMILKGILTLMGREEEISIKE
jgi:CubicO group peptidase (beta-lactamase class C family)